MFYIEKNNKITHAENDKRLLINTLPFLDDVTEADIKETNQEIENFMFVDSPEWIEWKSTIIRNIRDSYLKEYVDSIVSNPLRWADMSIEEQEQIKSYRRYLLDIPQTSDFPKTTVLTFDEYKEREVTNE